MNQSWVYILECSSGMYYTGCTSDLEQRLNQHRHGTFPGITKNLRPLKMVFSQEFKDINEAIAMEKRINGWSRKKKKALIEGNFDRLVYLSNKNKF